MSAAHPRQKMTKTPLSAAKRSSLAMVTVLATCFLFEISDMVIRKSHKNAVISGTVFVDHLKIGVK